MSTEPRAHTLLAKMLEPYLRTTRAAADAIRAAQGQLGLAFGMPVFGDRNLPVGKAYLLTDPRTGSQSVHVGIAGPIETEAVLIVREGLSEVLEWLGEPVHPRWLKVAGQHYGIEVPR